MFGEGISKFFSGDFISLKYRLPNKNLPFYLEII
jgi:hypothetical protein